MDADEIGRLTTLLRALDEVLEYHEGAASPDTALVRELEAKRRQLHERLARNGDVDG